MAALSPPTPLGEPLESLPLPRAPIVRVVSQVRFSPILSVSRADFIADLQEQLRKEYPSLEQEHRQTVKAGPEGIELAGPAETIWRFTSEDHIHRVSVGQTFVSLERKAYTSRAEYLDRLVRVLSVAKAVLDPGPVLRLGIRYHDRISGDPYRRLSDLIRPELLPLGGSEIGEGSMERSLGQVRLAQGDIQLNARWGCMPPSATIDPSIEPVDEETFVLDLDSYREGSRSFDVEPLIEEAWELTHVSYRFFRWAVLDEFLRTYGAHV